MKSLAYILPAGMALACFAPATAQAPPAAGTGVTLESCKASGDGRASWTAPAMPSRIHGNTWYVGTCGITVVLITSDHGHILIDGGPAEAAPLVMANIAKLGFRPSDVKWIISSHEHDDHVGALAELKRLTGAKVAALAAAAPALAAGRPNADDPQSAIAGDFAPIAVDRVLRHRDRVTLGPLSVTVHATPAHAPGSASWTWRSCDGGNCRDIAYADSATIISAPNYFFTKHPARSKAATKGLARIGKLPCDLLITPHPSASALFERLSGRQLSGDPPDAPQTCADYSRSAAAHFAARVAIEAASSDWSEVERGLDRQ